MRQEIVRLFIGALVIMALLHFWGYLSAIFKTFLYVTAISTGILLGCRSILFTNRKYELAFKEHYNNPVLHRLLVENLKAASLKIVSRTPTLISRNVDKVIEDIVGYVIRDYIHWWYKDLVENEQRVYKSLRIELWAVFGNIKERLKKMDDVQFFTHDIVIKMHAHLQKIREISSNTNNGVGCFGLSTFLESPETEKNHLRRLTDFLLALILPSKYGHCQPFRHLLREILACLVFYPAIEIICDPDYINQKLLSYLLWQQAEVTKLSQPYTYAKNFKDFLQIINKTNDVNSLVCMRGVIITEIIQATTINNLKKAKGIDVDKEFRPQTTDKGDLLQSRNLRLYIKQLTEAKAICEKQIKSLGGKEEKTSPGESTGKMVLSFSVIMEYEFCRKYFGEHLQKHEHRSLLGFWEMVHEMKMADKASKHQIGNEIIQIYVNNPISIVKLPKSTLKGMQAYMMADKGPEAFYQAQEDLYKLMEERFYPTFIVSGSYSKMLSTAKKHGINFKTGSEGLKKEEPEMDETLTGQDGIPSITVSGHPSLAGCLLKQTTDKLNDKKQALQTFLSSSADSKVVHTLEKEISELETEVSDLESYIQRTSSWMNYLGQWEAKILDLRMRENDRAMDVIIHVSARNKSNKDIMTDSKWTISRSITDFHNLQQRLILPATWLKGFDLPNPNRSRFRMFERDTYLNKVQEQLQTFLDAILDDEELNKSEAVYEFLVILPDMVKNSLPQVKKSSRFSFIQFFKSSQGSAQEDCSDDELLFLDEVDGKEDKKDSIAEPLYALVGDVFELKGVFNMFRRTLIAFVQISFGKTINKQLRETVSWISSEPMLQYYLELFRDSLWPNGKASKPKAERSEHQKEETRKKAKAELLNSVPDVLSNFVGQQNSRFGMAKIFESLQDRRLNKQLFYDVLEAFIYEFAPELKEN